VRQNDSLLCGGLPQKCIPQATEMNAERHDVNGFMLLSKFLTKSRFYRREIMISTALDRCGLWFSPMTNWHVGLLACQMAHNKCCNGNGRAAIDVDVNAVVTRPKLCHGGNFKNSISRSVPNLFTAYRSPFEMKNSRVNPN
jgi:hypothetical protein